MPRYQTIVADPPWPFRDNPPEPLPNDLLNALRERKKEVLTHLHYKEELLSLPFPLGYGGLPIEEVARAEAQNDRLGVNDPVGRKLNVLMWLWCHFRAQGETHLVSQIRDAYHELRHADPTMKAICGLCEYDS